VKHSQTQKSEPSGISREFNLHEEFGKIHAMFLMELSPALGNKIF